MPVFAPPRNTTDIYKQAFFKGAFAIIDEALSNPERKAQTLISYNAIGMHPADVEVEAVFIVIYQNYGWSVSPTEDGLVFSIA